MVCNYMQNLKFQIKLPHILKTKQLNFASYSCIEHLMNAQAALRSQDSFLAGGVGGSSHVSAFTGQ